MNAICNGCLRDSNVFVFNKGFICYFLVSYLCCMTVGNIDMEIINDLEAYR
jgi:hypothetical protein